MDLELVDEDLPAGALVGAASHGVSLLKVGLNGLSSA